MYIKRADGGQEKKIRSRKSIYCRWCTVSACLLISICEPQYFNNANYAALMYYGFMSINKGSIDGED